MDKTKEKDKKKKKKATDAPYIPTHEVPDPPVPNRAHTEMSLGNFEGGDSAESERSLGNFEC